MHLLWLSLLHLASALHLIKRTPVDSPQPANPSPPPSALLALSWNAQQHLQRLPDERRNFASCTSPDAVGQGSAAVVEGSRSMTARVGRKQGTAREGEEKGRSQRRKKERKVEVEVERRAGKKGKERAADTSSQDSGKRASLEKTDRGNIYDDDDGRQQETEGQEGEEQEREEHHDKRRKREKQKDWPLDEQSEREYRRAVALFNSRFQIFQQSGGKRYVTLRKSEEHRLGKAGARLFRALAEGHRCDRNNASRRLESSKVHHRRISIQEEEEKEAAEGTVSKYRSASERRCRRVRLKLAGILQKKWDPTIFTSGELADIEEFLLSKTNEHIIGRAFELFLELAPNIKLAWHANVLKRFKDAQLQPDITEELLARLRHWLHDH